MNETRRSEILARAQQELRRSRGQRVLRRRSAAVLAVLAASAALGSAWVVLSTPHALPDETTTVATEASGAPQVPTNVAQPNEPSATPVIAVSDQRWVPSERFQVVTALRPSQGFVQVIDDVDFEVALHSLSKPAGVAVIGGRTRIVSNPGGRTNEPIQ